MADDEIQIQDRKIQLTGEQKRILTLPVKGAVLIKGCAGSGKTLIAVKRAEHLRQTYSDMFRSGRIGIFAFNREIINSIGEMLDSGTGAGITVWTFDKWVFDFLGLRRSDCHTAQELAKVLSETRSDAAKTGGPVLQKPDRFILEEIAWIKGRGFTRADEYLSAKRAGRGTAVRLTADDRRALWDLHERYQAALAARGWMDFEDRALKALERTEEPGFDPPFTHVVIDEAQDLSPVRLRLLTRLVKPDPGSITVIADSAQRIYQSGFAWRDVGLNVTGRSFELKHNYRNTRQISEAAASLLRNERERGDFTEMVAGRREGEKPAVYTGDDRSNCDELVRRLRGTARRAVVAAYSNESARDLARLLAARGFEVNPLGNVWKRIEGGLSGAGRNDGGPAEAATPRVNVCTFHSLKGLEFDGVYLWDVSRGKLCGETELRDQQAGISDGDDELVSRTRKTLYVAMTRAREELVIFCSGRPSVFVDEIDPSLVTRTRTPRAGA